MKWLIPQFGVRALLAAIAILAIILAAVVWGYRSTRDEFSFENRSNQAVKQMTVKVCNRTYHLQNVAPGEVVKVTIVVDGDGSFEVAGVFDDGTPFSGVDSYVTGDPFGSRSHISVDESGQMKCETESKQFW